MLGSGYVLAADPFVGGSDPFPVVAAVTNGTDGTGTSATVNLPAGTIAGDLLIVIGVFLTTPTAPTTPAGWSVNASNSMRIYYKFADGSEGASIAVSWTGSQANRWFAFRIAGCSLLPEFGTSATATSANPNPPSATPTWGVRAALWIAVEKNDSADAVSAYPTSYTDNQYSSTADTPRLALATRNLAAGTEDPGAFTIAGSTTWRTQTIAVR